MRFRSRFESPAQRLLGRFSYPAYDLVRLRECFHEIIRAPRSFDWSEVKYLGYIISQDGIKFGDDRIQGIAGLLEPISVKELRLAYDASNFVHKYVPRFSESTEPLVAHTGKNVAQHRFFRRFRTLGTRVPSLLLCISSPQHCFCTFPTWVTN